MSSHTAALVIAARSRWRSWRSEVGVRRANHSCDFAGQIGLHGLIRYLKLRLAQSCSGPPALSSIFDQLKDDNTDQLSHKISITTLATLNWTMTREAGPVAHESTAIPRSECRRRVEFYGFGARGRWPVTAQHNFSGCRSLTAAYFRPPNIAGRMSAGTLGHRDLSRVAIIQQTGRTKDLLHSAALLLAGRSDP